MISAVIAAFNGERFIADQILSVLPQLGAGDELLVSDDNPSDPGTAEAVKRLAESDGRIKYLTGPSKGVIKNFEFLISRAKGDYIFLCDQDDVWLEGKVEAVMKEFDRGADVVMHNAYITDGALDRTGATTFEMNRAGTGIIKNIVKNTYQGSCMAFRSELKKYILPFPDRLPMHDQWIGLVGEKHGSVRLIDRPYLLYRRHGSNLSGNGSSALQKLKWRIDIVGCLLRK